MKHRFEQPIFKTFSCLDSYLLEVLYSPDATKEKKEICLSMYGDEVDVIS